jgi:hypothetical protein
MFLRGLESMNFDQIKFLNFIIKSNYFKSKNLKKI